MIELNRLRARRVESASMRVCSVERLVKCEVEV